MATTVAPPEPQSRAQSDLIDDDTPPMQPEVVRYASSDVRCPSCHKWRAALWIEADGALRCRPCPVVGRRPKSEGGTAA